MKIKGVIMSTMETISPSSFKKKIWDYYQREGRKLPWRETRNPYRILVSEIMLQQTQVSRVLVKYQEFLKAFPNFESLANAPIPKLLSVWQGMGYNRRALALKKVAHIVTKEYHSKLPNDLELLVTLPGIGKGTAGSLSAFVFNKPVSFIETNIRRVFIHFFFPMRGEVRDQELLPFIEKTVDKKNPREWYYALMDYGSMLGKMERLENPNRRSKHYVIQSRFEGSNRALRGQILKMLIAKKRISLSALKRFVAYAPKQVEQATEQLAKEGFIKREGSFLRIV